MRLYLEGVECILSSDAPETNMDKVLTHTFSKLIIVVVETTNYLLKLLFGLILSTWLDYISQTSFQLGAALCLRSHHGM